MASLDRTQLTASAPGSLHITLDNCDGAVRLFLTPPGGAQPLSIRLQPNDAAEIGSRLLELSFLLDKASYRCPGH